MELGSLFILGVVWYNCCWMCSMRMVDLFYAIAGLTMVATGFVFLIVGTVYLKDGSNKLLGILSVFVFPILFIWAGILTAQGGP